MSRESALHVSLVELVASEIRRQHGHLYSLVVLIDLPKFGRNRPAHIGGYVPDVFALDVPETCRLIGEAKTAVDLETQRSEKQIQAFLRHLSVFPNSGFYLSVPWFCRTRAQVLVASVAQSVGASGVAIHVIGG